MVISSNFSFFLSFFILKITYCICALRRHINLVSLYSCQICLGVFFTEISISLEVIGYDDLVALSPDKMCKRCKCEAKAPERTSHAFGLSQDKTAISWVIRTARLGPSGRHRAVPSPAASCPGRSCARPFSRPRGRGERATASAPACAASVVSGRGRAASARCARSPGGSAGSSWFWGCGAAGRLPPRAPARSPAAPGSFWRR